MFMALPMSNFANLIHTVRQSSKLDQELLQYATKIECWNILSTNM